MAEGFELYNEAVEKLYQRSARWKICLKCGVIDKKDSLDETSHQCSLGIGKLPVIIPTSWVVLKDFFLTDAYTQALHKLGVEPVPARKVPATVPSKAVAIEQVEEIAEEPIEVEVSDQ